jgi:hypothetical protein
MSLLATGFGVKFPIMKYLIEKGTDAHAVNDVSLFPLVLFPLPFYVS